MEDKNHNSLKHMVLMILACVVPLALIFLLPIFGISSKWTIAGSVGLMIILHIWVMKDCFPSNHESKSGSKR